MHERIQTRAAMAVLVAAGVWWSAVPARAGVIPSDFAAVASSFAGQADFDCDRRADISRRVHNGVWEIDLAANGLGRKDIVRGGYGDSTAIPVPADYDGDCRADLSVKAGDGYWLIDYASDGFGGWNAMHPGYGPATSVPVPADYDGDGKADLSVKDEYGVWYIDYAANGFGAWNAVHPGYGPASSVPVPADYDGDGWADLSVKGGNGCWYIDYAANGFGAWNAVHCGYGPGSSVPTPADYDGDGRADLSIRDKFSYWYIDYAADGFGAWNAIHPNYRGGLSHKYEPVPADYDGDGRADPGLHSDDEYWYVDYSGNGLGVTGNGAILWDYHDALAVPVMPSIALVEHTAHSLTVNVTAAGTDLAGRSAAERVKVSLSGVDFSTFGQLVRGEFTDLRPDTEYCIVGTATNSEGSTSRTACFRTDYEAPTSGTTLVFLYRQRVVEGAIPYQGNWGPIAGARPVRLWSPGAPGLPPDYFIHFLRVGHHTGECFGPNHDAATVTLDEGGSLGPEEIALIFGGPPPVGQRLWFVACLSVSGGSTPSSVLFDLDWAQ